MRNGERLVHEEKVKSNWVDYNGHMNVAYYVLIFDHATDAFFELLDMGEQYRNKTKSSNFVVESHVSYIREVVEGDLLQVACMLLNYDTKRIHLFHHMYNASNGELCATIELLIIHVDLVSRRSAVFPGEILKNLQIYLEDQKSFIFPEQAGSIIGLK